MKGISNKIKYVLRNGVLISGLLGGGIVSAVWFFLAPTQPWYGIPMVFIPFFTMIGTVSAYIKWDKMTGKRK